MSDCPSEILSDGTSEGALSEGDAGNTTIPGLVVKDIYLQVPDLKRDRAASVDSCFSKVSQGKTEELQHSGVSLEVPVGPNVALRSRSVDIVLPTDEQARYKALAMAAPAASPSYRYVQYRMSVARNKIVFYNIILNKFDFLFVFFFFSNHKSNNISFQHGFPLLTKCLWFGIRFVG